MSTERPPASLPADLVADLDLHLRDAFVQDVRIADDTLLVVSLRLPGQTLHVGFSVLPGASGVLLQDSAPRGTAGATGPLVAVRDAARAALTGARVALVGASARGDALVLAVLRAESSQAPAALVLGAADSQVPDVAILSEGRVSASFRPIPPSRSEDAPALVAALMASRPESVTVAPAAAAGEAGRLERLSRHSTALAGLRRQVAARRSLEVQARHLQRAATAAARLVERREADAAKLGDPEETRQAAHALGAHLHLVRRGQAELVLLDWPGASAESPLVIALDPALAPAANLRAWHDRATKAARGLATARHFLAEAESRERSLRELLERTQHVLGGLPANEEELLAAAGTLLADAAPWLGRTASAKGRRVQLRASPFRRHLSVDGHEILVGRSARANDELTFKVAHGNDIWLHARDAPGPHVLVRLPRGAEVPEGTLLDAATLAHALSKRGTEPQGEVSWCRAKDVQKRRGMPAGQVLVAHERTLLVRVEPERLARLQSSASALEDP